MRPYAIALAVALALTGAGAAQASGRRPVDLPAGRLADAAIALGRQAGISIGIADPAIANRRVRAVRGKMDAVEALRRMLEGTGAAAVPIDGASWRIVRRPDAAPSPPATLIDARFDKPSVAPPTPPIEDLIVTATKRDTPLPAYAGTATVISGGSFSPGAAAQGSDAIAARMPTVTSTHIGPGRNKLFIRGIADSSFTGPTQATAGQYLGDTRLNYNAPDPDLRLYDVSRVEVLEGPQGTLYGAGSLGGVIRIVRNAPQLEVAEGAASAGASLTAHGAPSVDGSAMLNLPIIYDQIGLRLVAYGASDGGYIDDLRRGLKDVNRTRSWGGRAALRLRPSDAWTIDLGTVWQQIDGADGQYATKGLPPLTRRSALAQGFANNFLLGDISIAREWDLMRFTLTSGVVWHNLDEIYDATLPLPQSNAIPTIPGTTDPLPLPPGTAEDGIPRIFFQANRTMLWSTEARLSRAMDNGFGWLIGASLIRNRARITRLLGDVDDAMQAINGIRLTGVRNVVNEATLFGEASIEPAAGVTLTAGGRIGHVRLSGDGLDIAEVDKILAARTMSASRGETSFLPSLSISARPTDNLVLYARYQEGFRPGGLAIRDDQIERFRNDNVSTIEAGIRFGAPGLTRFHASAAVAYTRWKNIQADIIDGQGLPATANIGDGRVYSFDARIGWQPFAGLSLDAAAFINRSKVTQPDVAAFVSRSSATATAAVDVDDALRAQLDNMSLPNVARVGVRASADWTTAISDTADFSLSASVRYVGKSRLGVGPLLGKLQGDYVDTALFARIGWERFGFSLTVTNIFDTVGNRFALGSPFTVYREDQITPLRPRTVRLGVDVRF